MLLPSAECLSNLRCEIGGHAFLLSADLHVISRTSVMVYKESTASVGQIARELRVGTVRGTG